MIRYKNQKLFILFVFLLLLVILRILHTSNWNLTNTFNASSKFAIFNDLDSIIQHELSSIQFITDTQKTNLNTSLLCIILTSTKTIVKRSVTVWNTWAKKCDKALFACNCDNWQETFKTDESVDLLKKFSEYNFTIDIPVWNLNVTETHDHMAGKVLLIVKSIYEMYAINSTYKWFMLADDDTFVFVDNLNKFILNRSHDDPLTYGYNFKIIVPNGYHSGGGGILFTKESLKRMHPSIEKGLCNDTVGFGDVAVGLCAYKSNVSMGHSLDHIGRERFHPLDIKAHLKEPVPGWLMGYASNEPKNGEECCSDESITFHYTNSDRMIMLSRLGANKKLSDIYPFL